MRHVIQQALVEANRMLIVDCPLCDGPAPFDADEAALECDACGVRLELAETDPPALAAAA